MELLNRIPIPLLLVVLVQVVECLSTMDDPPPFLLFLNLHLS